MKKINRVLLRVMGWTAALALVAGTILVFVGLKYHSDYEARAAKFDLKKIGEVSQRSAVYDVNSDIYSHLHGQNRLVIPLESVSGWFVQALLAREDTRFWEHDGIDYKGIVRAAVTNFRKGEVKQGASTLTQQLARNALDLQAESYDRKALEAVLAKRIERTFSKKEILELYINRIYFGSGFYGLETAARGYFNKSASELDLSESALLAGIICSPHRLSPRRNLPDALEERDMVLDRMVELHMIREEDALRAKAVRMAINQENPLRFQEDYVMDAVNRELAEVLSPDLIEWGGLKIYTTIDPQLQKVALEAADRQLTKIEEQKKWPHPKKADFQPEAGEAAEEKPTDYLQAALVAVDNRTGAIRALVGGRDYEHSKYSRALLSKRQIGSTFKPFVYAAAFQRGMLPGTLVSDDEIVASEIRQVSRKPWSPENSDGKYVGLQPASWGLAKSRNTMAVRVGEFAGLRTVARLADNLGIGEAMPDLPVSYLGAFETTVKELTAAYSVFPNFGVLRPVHLISRVEDSHGNVLYRMNDPERQVIAPEAAWMTSEALQDVMKTGTAAKAASLGWKKPSGGKTGTTNDFFDAWFVGYTSSLTCGVWVGMDQPQTIQEKAYGSTLALPIWVDFMGQVPEKVYPMNKLEAPFQLTKATLCSASGARATSQCQGHGSTYQTHLPAGRIPSQTCTVHPEAAPLYAAQSWPGRPAEAPRAVAELETPDPYSTQNLPPAGERQSVASMPPQAEVRQESAREREEDRPPVVINGVEVVGRGAERAQEEAETAQRAARFYNGGSQVRPAANEQPEETIRVRRAIPVRRAVPVQRGGDAPVYRAEPVVERRGGEPRVLRAIPVE